LPLSEHEKTENIKDKELWRVYARGMTGKLSGSVYHWNSVDAFPTNCKRIVWGLDIGWTNDPTVLTKIAIAPVGLDYDYVFQELSYAPGISAGYINQLLIENGYKFGQPVYMDHSNPLKKQLRSLRIVAVNAEKGKGSVEARVLHLRSNRCAYTKDSENISMELSKYVFLEVNGELRNQPIGTNNHAMNSCEYGAYTDYVHNRNKI
jgi:phage terminase large subunit